MYNSIEEIEGNLWDSVVLEDQLVKTHRFLNAVERANLKHCRFRYLLFFEAGELVANASLFSMDFYLDTLAAGFIKKIFGQTKRFFPNFLKVKLVGCGTPIATCTNGIGIKKIEHLKDVVCVLSRTISQIASEERAHCMVFKEYNAEETRVLDILQGNGFTKFHSLPTSFIDIHWSSFQEYLHSLKKKYRLQAKNDLLKLEPSEITVEVCENFGPYADTLWTLYLNVYEKAEVKFEKLTPEFFRNIAEHLHGESRALLIKLNNRVIAFELILEDRETLRPLYLGIDYDFIADYSLYFNSIYQILSHGIERKKKTIELGQTSYYPKLKVGAKMEPLFLYLKFRSSFAKLFFEPFMRLMLPERTVESKDVFNAGFRRKEKIL